MRSFAAFSVSFIRNRIGDNAHSLFLLVIGGERTYDSRTEQIGERDFRSLSNFAITQRDDVLFSLISRLGCRRVLRSVPLPAALSLFGASGKQTPASIGSIDYIFGLFSLGRPCIYVISLESKSRECAKLKFEQRSAATAISINNIIFVFPSRRRARHTHTRVTRQLGSVVATRNAFEPPPQTRTGESVQGDS